MKTWLCMLLLCSAACGKVDATKVEAAPEQHAVTEAEFALSPVQFVAAFNAAAQSYGQPYRLGNIELKHGVVHDDFQHAFTARMSLTAGVSKESGRLTNVTVLMAGNGEAAECEALRPLAEIVAATGDPSLSPDKTARLLADMMNEVRRQTGGKQFPQRFIKRVRYVLRYAGGIGCWWQTTPV